MQLTNVQEVWTLCRILKRKSMFEWKELTAAKRNSNPSAETCSNKLSPSSNLQENYISFSNPLKHNYEERPFGISVNGGRHDNNVDYHIINGSQQQQQQLLIGQQINSPLSQSHYPPPYPAAAVNSLPSFTSATPDNITELILKYADWESFGLL